MLSKSDIDILENKSKMDTEGVYHSGYDSVMAVSDPETEGILAGWSYSYLWISFCARNE